MSSSTITPLEVLDNLHITKSEISFLSSLISAWDLNQSPISHNDLYCISRMCDRLNENLGEYESFMKDLVKKNTKKKR